MRWQRPNPVAKTVCARQYTLRTEHHDDIPDLSRLSRPSPRRRSRGAASARTVRDARLPRALRRPDAAHAAREMELHPERARKATCRVELGGVRGIAARNDHARHPLRHQVVEIRYGMD